MGRSGLQEIDPEAVQLKPPSAKVESKLFGEACCMAIKFGLQLSKDAGARGEIIERGVGGVSAIAVGLRPGPSSPIFPRQHATGAFQFRPEIFEVPVCAKGCVIDRGWK